MCSRRGGAAATVNSRTYCLILVDRFRLAEIAFDPSNYILHNLEAALRRLDLTFFLGFSEIKSPPRLAWRFGGTPISFGWNLPVILLAWRFQPELTA